jgi:hypothetical protein
METRCLVLHSMLGPTRALAPVCLPERRGRPWNAKPRARRRVAKGAQTDGPPRVPRAHTQTNDLARHSWTAGQVPGDPGRVRGRAAGGQAGWAERSCSDHGRRRLPCQEVQRGKQLRPGHSAQHPLQVRPLAAHHGPNTANWAPAPCLPATPMSRGCGVRASPLWHSLVHLA